MHVTPPGRVPNPDRVVLWSMWQSSEQGLEIVWVAVRTASAVLGPPRAADTVTASTKANKGLGTKAFI